MKHLILFFLLLIVSCNNYEPMANQEKIFLDKDWKFHPGDIANLLSCVDTGDDWNPIKINKPWQDQDYNDHYGYAVYQCRFFLPKRIRSGMAKDTLKMFFGIIGDSEQLFLNGTLIGENAKNLPPRKSYDKEFIKTDLGWITSRLYKIAADSKLLQWDGKNVITIRVFSNSETGGLKYGVPYIQMQSLGEDLVIDKLKFYAVKDEKSLDTNLRLFNQNKRMSFQGDLFITAENMVTKEMVKQKIENIRLHPLDTSIIPFSIPETEDSVQVKFRFEDHNLKKSIRDSLTLPFVLIKN